MAKFEIRQATDQDRPAIVDTIRAVFNGDEEFAQIANFFTSSLHANSRPETAWIAVDRLNGRIAAVEMTATMTWMYDGISLKVLVLLLTGTHPDYRGCNAMPLIHEKLNEWMLENEYDIAFVEGVPWYYRRLGYQPLGLRPDSTAYDRFSLPKGKKNLEKLAIRPFEEKDLPLAVELLACKAKDMLYSFTYDEKWAKMFTLDYFEESRDLSATICGVNGEAIGVILSYTKNCRGDMYLLDYVLKPDVSHLEVTPAVMEFLAMEGDRQMNEHGGCKKIVMPYDVNTREILMDCLQGVVYVNKQSCKLIDIPGYIKKIAPILERRIAASPICGYTNVVGIQLFGHKQGLTITFKNGLVEDVDWRDVDFVKNSLAIQIPYEKFIRLIFGVECIDDMRQEHREVNSKNGERLNNEMRLLLKVMFPKKLSYVMHSC